MTIDRFDATNRERWLGMRKLDVTASVAGCLLGVHDYMSAYQLWALKTGKLAEDPEETPPMRRGRLLEPVALQMLLEDNLGWQVENPGLYFRDTERRIGATPDAIGTRPDKEGIGIVQIKSVAAPIYRDKWINKETEQPEVPLWIAVQAIVEAKLVGAEWAVVTPLVIGFGLELPVLDVPIHEGVWDRLCNAVAEFWQLVDEGKSPPPDYGRDAEVLAKIYADEDGTIIDLTRDNELPPILAERASLAKQKTAIGKRQDEIKAELLHKVGNASLAYVQGGELTAKTVKRKAYEVRAAQYRDIRFREAK